MEGANYTQLATAVTAAIADIVPVGLTIMGAMIGVTMIPKIIYRFL